MNRLEAKNIATDNKCQIISDEKVLVERYGSYYHDESKLHAAVLSDIAFPNGVEQLAWVLERNYREDIPSTIASARTGLVGGAVAATGASLVSLDKMAKISGVKYCERIERWVLSVQAGVSLQEVNRYLQSEKPEFYFPVDPTETSASIGGMAATNASGARSFYYGSIRDWVTWIRVVLPDGQILELRRGEVQVENNSLVFVAGDEERELSLDAISKPNTKNTIGYSFSEGMDAVDLFVGSEGTIGVITDLELRLALCPAARLYYLQFFRSEDALLSFVELMRSTESLQMLAIESWDRHSLELVRESNVPKDCRAARMASDEFVGAIYTELLFESEDELGEIYETLEGVLGDVNEDFSNSVAGIEDKNLRDMKMFRHAVPELINATIARRQADIPELHKIATDMAVEEAHFRELYSFYQNTLERLELEYAMFGHIGNNHLHVNIMPRDIEELHMAKECYLEFAKKVVELGGNVSAEHGIGRIKRPFLQLQYSKSELANMKKIKDFFDPKGLLNPGVLFE